MPQQYKTNLIDTIITRQRISSYTNVFKTTNDFELIGIYLWNSYVCGVLHPISSMTEVTLRNSIDSALRKRFQNSSSNGLFWWSSKTLHYKSYISGGQRPYKVDKLVENFSKSTNKVNNKVKQQAKTANTTFTTLNHQQLHNEIIAQTDFSTWEYILDSEFNGNNLIWPSQLGKVFKGWSSLNLRSTQLLSQARDLVSTIRNFRNRLCHHQPIWKKFGVSDEASAIIHLQDKIQKHEELLKLISPDSVTLLENEGMLPRARRACSIDTIQYFRGIAVTHQLKSMDDFNKLIDKCFQEDTTLKVEVLHKGASKSILWTPA